MAFTKGLPIIAGRQLRVLTDGDFQRLAPSAFANEPAPGASPRYQFVRTADVVDTLRAEGWEVVNASQSAAKVPGGETYVKHVVKLMHRDYIDGKVVVGDYIPELAITNAHNRTAAYELLAALRVLACDNGMMATAGDYGRIRVLHNDPKMKEHIIEGMGLVREVQENYAAPRIERMRAIELQPAQAIEFATGATLLKWGDARPDHAEALLQVRRAEDDGNSLWQVMNRVQENAMKGGYQARDRAGRNITVAGINSVNRDIDFNVALWQFGNKVLDIVAA